MSLTPPALRNSAERNKLIQIDSSDENSGIDWRTRTTANSPIYTVNFYFDLSDVKRFEKILRDDRCRGTKKEDLT